MNDSLKFSMLIPLLFATICTAADIKVDFEINHRLLVRMSVTATTVHGAINPPRPAPMSTYDFDVNRRGRNVSYNGYPTYSYSYCLQRAKRVNLRSDPSLQVQEPGNRGTLKKTEGGGYWRKNRYGNYEFGIVICDYRDQ